MATVTIRTEAELADLKRQWYADPIWDIETTEGFEAHRDELLAYRRECEARWNAHYTELLLEKAEQIGVPGNIALAAYVLRLEREIKELREMLDDPGGR